MNKWLAIWLIFVAASYLIPWWNQVYFLWDDIEFLMRLRSPTLITFLTSHQYQLHPVFQILYWAEIQLFGVIPAAFLSVSVAIHLINICLVYSLIKKLTANQTLSLLAAILVSFNKSFFTVIFWPTIQSNLILTTFLLISFHLFLEFRGSHCEERSDEAIPTRLPRSTCGGARNDSKITLLLFSISLILSGLSFGFGVGAGFVFAAAAIAFWKKSSSRVLTATTGITAGVIPILGILLLSTTEIQKDQIFQLSPMRIFNIVYFTLVGASQAVISRFFLPGFIPNIYSPANIAVMIALPAIVLAFFTWVIIKNIKNKESLTPLFLFSGYTIIPYFIAGLARSGPGALGGLAERYIYTPFFFFILALVYALYLISRQRKFPTYMIKLILPGAVAILSIGQQIVMHLEVSRLFL